MTCSIATEAVKGLELSFSSPLSTTPKPEIFATRLKRRVATYAKSSRRGYFILKQKDDNNPADIPALPVSDWTSDPKVIQIAKDWITECANGQDHGHDKCKSPDTPWHPNRLLDLQPMLESGRATEKVQLVSQKRGERRSGQRPVKGPYLTLSHRWGKAPFFKLTRETRNELLDGIDLSSLPRTFQDTVKVACELKISWLWIDALCIVQGEEDLKDWLEESATMEKVYAHSYCNISATAAWDSSCGLFARRDKSWKWVDSVTLNTKDLRDGPQGRIDCIILDLSFWEKYVDNAPVNRRSWVYQERLLAPRVLHWCENQIAFECRESGVLIDGVRLKSVDLDAGKRLRVIREASISGKSTDSTKLLNMVNEADPHLHFYELWKHWVEVYTKMELTNPRDRLIALSGIARMMASKMEEKGFQDIYIAGMWQKHLASQLLWFVNEGTGKNRQPYENTRPKEYRAPSFSWASVETPRGITFPGTEDKELLVQVEVVRLSYRSEDDMFGLLTDGYLVLNGVLRKIELTDSMSLPKRPPPSKVETFARAISWDRLLIASLVACFIPFIFLLQLCGLQCLAEHRTLLIAWTGFSLVGDPQELASEDRNRYSWRLVQDGHPVGNNYQIVYLDSPASEPSIFGPDARVYCLPVLKEDRYLTCLLVRATDGEYGMRYERVGLTKVSSLTPDLLHNLTTAPGHNKSTSGRYYWSPESRMKGESTICIV
ncbi:hypothetical protein AYO22_04044 [Fonsecaea multimorphosa]|nr:hypothetical protein AYO22_04044 [Fonsecaea multimorphosa]